jgi:hypothetical protein
LELLDLICELRAAMALKTAAPIEPLADDRTARKAVMSMAGSLSVIDWAASRVTTRSGPLGSSRVPPAE